LIFFELGGEMSGLSTSARALGNVSDAKKIMNILKSSKSEELQRFE
jgi:hypothetical protein